MKLDRLTAEMLNNAVTIYLQYAYDDPDDAEAKRIAFPSRAPSAELLGAFRDETETGPEAHRLYSLQLGSSDYPHMKLALWEAFYRGEYVFVVDAHDNFRFDKSAPDYDDWLALKNRNRERKFAIEDAWYAAGLSTLRKLKEAALSRSQRIRAFQGCHVLLVDDDADAAVIVRLILEAAGFRCHWVKTNREALDLIDAGDTLFAVALVDIVMADGDGLDLVKAMRGEPRTQEVPIYLTSAMSREDVDLQGADGYLRKPFNGETLVRLVEDSLVRRQVGEARFLDPEHDRTTVRDSHT